MEWIEGLLDRVLQLIVTALGVMAAFMVAQAYGRTRGAIIAVVVAVLVGGVALVAARNIPWFEDLVKELTGIGGPAAGVVGRPVGLLGG